MKIESQSPLKSKAMSLEAKARRLRRQDAIEKYRRPEYEVKGTNELFETAVNLCGVRGRHGLVYIRPLL